MAFISPDRNELVSIVARNAFIIFGVIVHPLRLVLDAKNDIF